MTTTDAGPPVPGLLARLTAGVVGGLAGGVVFGSLMQILGMIPMVAQLIDRDSLLAGWTVHMAIAAFIGLLYALVFGLIATVLPMATALGIFYGLVWWLLGGLTLLPLRLGHGLFVFDTAAWQSLTGHLVYGLTLSVVCALVGRLAPEPGRRRRTRRAAPVPEPPPPTPPRTVANRPASVTPASAFPRTRWTPLTSDIRALRRQQHGEKQRPG